jgi:hypothetical protein
MGTERNRSSAGLGLSLSLGALALIIGMGFTAGPFAALAAAGACLFLLGLAAGLKMPITPPKT